MNHYVDINYGPPYSGRIKPVENSIDRWSGLSNLSRYLLETNTLHDLLDKTSRAIVEILNLDFIRIFTLNSNGHYYYQVAYSKDPLEVSSQAENPALLTAELIFKQIAISEPPLNPYFLGEAFSPEECLAIAGNVNAEIWLVPLSANSQKLGFLVLGKEDGNKADRYMIESTHLVDLIAGQLSNAILRVNLNACLSDSALEIVRALTKALEARDINSSVHSENMAKLCDKLAIRIGCSEKESLDIYWAALLHDIGKIGVEDRILHKPGSLTDDEWVIMKKHPEIGAKIVQGMTGFDRVAPLILMHHERLDGSGYPCGLKKDEISAGARIIAVVDTYMAITEGRNYRAKRSHEEAIHELVIAKGTLFDSGIVDQFVQMVSMA